ncbi:unnamed protein product [Rhizophagus irregularis]|nr:unnamed protein product [Rhizophagus irregularis]
MILLDQAFLALSSLPDIGFVSLQDPDRMAFAGVWFTRGYIPIGLIPLMCQISGHARKPMVLLFTKKFLSFQRSLMKTIWTYRNELKISWDREHMISPDTIRSYRNASSLSSTNFMGSSPPHFDIPILPSASLHSSSSHQVSDLKSQG